MKKMARLGNTYKPYTDRFKNHPYAIPVTTFLLLFFISIAGFIGFNATTVPPSDAHVIELSMDGKRQSIPTRAETVGEFLQRIDARLGENDIVEPDQDTRIDDEKFHINVYRARPVTIVDSQNGARQFAYSAATTPRSVAQQAGVEIFPEDKVEATLPDNFLKEGVLGEKVVVDRSVPANINLYGSHVPVRTHARTVGELLKEKQVVLEQNDNVQPALDTPISPQVQVFVLRAGTQIATTEEEVAMPTETIEDASLSFGVRVVRQKGTAGKKVVTYQINLQNGRETGRTKIQEVVAVEPVKEIVARGKAAYIPGDKAGIMSAAGIPAGQQPYADYVISHESKWRANARNASGCAGLGQACPGSKLAAACPNWEVDPVCQMRYFSGYANGRYGSWQGAYNAWQRQHWW